MNQREFETITKMLEDFKDQINKSFDKYDDEIRQLFAFEPSDEKCVDRKPEDDVFDKLSREELREELAVDN